MKTLFLLRHAKSRWKDPDLADFDRLLNGRGGRSAEIIGRLIRREKLVLPLVISSPAVRTRETIEIIIRISKVHTDLRFDQRIYEASPVHLLEVISQIEEDRNVALIVGHNPGME